MKRQTILIIIISCLITFGLSAKEIKVKEQVHSFVKGMKQRTVRTYKSIYMDKKDNEKTAAENAFEGDLLTEYKIVNSDKVINRINKRLTEGFGKNKFTVKINSEESTLSVSRGYKGSTPGIKAKDFDLEAYKNKVLKILASFPDLINNLEYNLYSVESRKCVGNAFNPDLVGQEEVEKVNFNFVRLFKGATIRRMVSYVNISLNAEGELDTLAVVWPDFKATGREKLAVSMDIPLAKVLFSDNGSRLNYSDVPLIEEYHQTSSMKAEQ